MDNYKLNDIIEKLNKSKNDYILKIELWKKVERVTKKDGTEFAVLSKNFKNARIVPATVSIRPAYEIQVNDFVSGRYISDYFDITPIVRYYAGDVAPERIIKESFLEPYFNMNVEEIEKEIKRRIDKYTEYVKDYERQITEAERVFSKFSAAIETALKELKEEAGDNSSLYYQCREYMTKQY